MEEMVEVRKEVSDMPCGNAIPAEDAGHQTEKDVAGRESDRVPAPEMNCCPAKAGRKRSGLL